MSQTPTSFSFTQSAQSQNRRVTTEVLDTACRLPISDETDSYFEIEQTAQRALGLEPDERMIFISRLRLLEGKPAVFHRVYLDAKRFPEGFHHDHDFRTKSLIELYKHYGLTPLHRDTGLRAAWANVYERATLVQHHYNQEQTPVLRAEQVTYARDPATGKEFVLKYLAASYLENWLYLIRNRPPG